MKFLISAIMVVTLQVWTHASLATTINYNTDNLVTGLSNVDVGGQLYNVAFSNESYYDTFGMEQASPSMFDFTLPSTASQYVTLNGNAWLFTQTLVDLFNTSQFRHLRGKPQSIQHCTNIYFCNLVIPATMDLLGTTGYKYLMVGGYAAVIPDDFGNADSRMGAFSAVPTTANMFNASLYTVWTAVHVDTPSTLSLFCLIAGLVGGISVRNRQAGRCR